MLPSAAINWLHMERITRPLTQRRSHAAASFLIGLGVAGLGCGDGSMSGGPLDDPGASDPAAVAALPYAREVISFERGDHAGFGADDFPEVVLGPPQGGGSSSGSFDVLALGRGGEIVLGFGDEVIVDEAGDDFVVFENAFWANGDPAQPYVEPAEVSVSEDGEDWRDFPCEERSSSTTGYVGCAGLAPTLAYDPLEIVPLDVEYTGGDAFDLEDVGLETARFVRIRDRSPLEAVGKAAGFDLDAVGIIHVGR
jgi:hypothetical protein